ncbi:single-stranded DNA-binding protein [Myceligenerans crystallogenes]|uniref:Single-stranded DNA-binding protein n=1 Tax=Myceligenerans crystallogenes TaxID=316335 RepID=A0ABN2N5T6_9MICO
MSNEVMVTVTGNAGSTPVINRSARGTEWTQFSVASTRRIRGADGGFHDGQTLWFKVKAWGLAASNIAASVEKGQPLVVTGRLEVDEWQSELGPRMGLVINAETVGHNLARGRTAFTRVVQAAEPPGAPVEHGGGMARSGAHGQPPDPYATSVPRSGPHGLDGDDDAGGPDAEDHDAEDHDAGDSGGDLAGGEPDGVLEPVGAGAGRDRDLTA